MNDSKELATLKATLVENLTSYIQKSLKVRVYFTTDEPPEQCVAIKKVNIPFIEGYFVAEITYGELVLLCGYIQI